MTIYWDNIVIISMQSSNRCANLYVYNYMDVMSDPMVEVMGWSDGLSSVES